jgi:hypothetical protein
MNPSLPPVDLLRTRTRPLVRPNSRVPPSGGMEATRGFNTPSPRTSDPRIPVPTVPNPNLARASLPRPSRARPRGRHALAGMAVRPSRSPATPVRPPPEGAHPSRHRRPVPCGTFETPTRGRQAGSTTRRCRPGRPGVARPLKEVGRPSYRKGVADPRPGSTPDSDRPLRKTVRHPSIPRRHPFGGGSCQWTATSAQRRMRVSSALGSSSPLSDSENLHHRRLSHRLEPACSVSRALHLLRAVHHPITGYTLLSIKPARGRSSTAAPGCRGNG